MATRKAPVRKKAAKSAKIKTITMQQIFEALFHIEMSVHYVSEVLANLDARMRIPAKRSSYEAEAFAMLMGGASSCLIDPPPGRKIGCPPRRRCNRDVPALPRIGCLESIRNLVHLRNVCPPPTVVSGRRRPPIPEGDRRART
jgi:hypothetical protein